MDSSDEEDVALFLLMEAEERHGKKRKTWVRQHFQMRPELGEFHTTFQNLIDHPDETVFFNYMRMSYNSYKILKNLILPHISPIGSNWRKPVSGEEKLVLTIR